MDGGQNKVILYDFKGDYVISKSYNGRAEHSTFIDTNHIVNYIAPRSNESNPNVSALNIFTLQGDVSRYLTTNFESGKSPDSPWVLGALLARSSQNEVIFKEPFNDTIYVLKNDTLMPHLVFDGGEREKTPEDWATLEKSRAVHGKKIDFWGLHFTKDYDCITFKENGISKVVMYHPKSGSTMISAGEGGIINKNEGVDLFPRGIGMGNELVGFYLPHELKGANLNPEGKLHEIAEGLKDDDNPVVVVVDLKE